MLLKQYQPKRYNVFTSV